MKPSTTVILFETIAKNNQIVFKNKIKRHIATIYSIILKILGKNYLTKKQIPKEKLTQILLNINKKQIKLKMISPKGFKTSKDAENFVCNYEMCQIENYLRKHIPKTEFYFIHYVIYLPMNVNKTDKEKLMKFILC